MMKYIILGSFLIGQLMVSQETEIKAAVKGAESNNYALVIGEIAKVDAAYGTKIFTLDPKLQAQYYYAKGLGLMNTGKVTEGSICLGKVGDLELKPIWTSKNKTSKEAVYFTNQAEAEKYMTANPGFSPLKTTTINPVYAPKLQGVLQPMAEKSYAEAQAAHAKKDYLTAANKFLETYNLSKAMGNDNPLIEYFAAVSYQAGGKMDLAGPLYENLLQKNYTGERIIYSAENKKTKEVIKTENLADFNLYKSSGEFTNYKEEKTENYQPEIYANYTNLLVDTGNYPKAIEIAEAGLKKYPGNDLIFSSLGSAYYKSGKSTEFIALVKDAIAKNPNNDVNYYNLGVILSKEEATKEEAKQYFIKALTINPKNAQATWNYAAVTIEQAKAAGDKEGELLGSPKTRPQADAWTQKKKAYLKEALPYLEKAKNLSPDNVEILKALRSVYGNLEMETEYNQIKAELKALGN